MPDAHTSRAAARRAQFSVSSHATNRTGSARELTRNTPSPRPQHGSASPRTNEAVSSAVPSHQPLDHSAPVQADEEGWTTIVSSRRPLKGANSVSTTIKSTPSLPSRKQSNRPASETTPPRREIRSESTAQAPSLVQRHPSGATPPTGQARSIRQTAANGITPLARPPTLNGHALSPKAPIPSGSRQIVAQSNLRVVQRDARSRRPLDERFIQRPNVRNGHPLHPIARPRDDGVDPDHIPVNADNPGRGAWRKNKPSDGMR